ncbi:MAG TPA: ABC transporter permease [Micromonosporaceae bacterium]|nr:ABC transporter permease [Micromonosporaceae bacterium]
MTTTAARATAPPTSSAGSGALTGTGKLLRFNLRRDRIRIPVWVAALGLVQVTAPDTYQGLYPTAADRMNQAAVIGGNPAMKAMTGPGHGLDNYTYGAMMANEYLGFMLIFVALMSVLIVVRHTRTEEETGRAELVRANVVGRHAHLTAALLTAATANVALGLLVAVGMGGAGVESIDWPGSLLFGTVYAVTGLLFVGVAAVTAQISPFSRSASGMAGALIGLAYALRALGDMGDGPLSWLSPIGWAQATAVYVDNRWWPVLLALAVAAVLVAAAYLLRNRRDEGAGLRAERSGAATGSAWLGTPQGFAWRLHRSSVLWWAAAMFLFGAMYGSAVDVMEEYSDNEVVRQVVENIGGATITESWLSMIISLLAIICSIFSVIAALRPRREETAGRAEAVLATGVSRLRWLASHVVISMAGGLLLLLVAGLGLGLSAAATSGEGRYVRNVLWATLAYAPALWLTAGLAVAVFGLAPRAIGLAWALLVWAVLMTYFGGLLDLPQWMLNLSPYLHIPRMPAADFTAVPLAILTLLAALLVAAGLAGFRRRDLAAT